MSGEIKPYEITYGDHPLFVVDKPSTRETYLKENKVDPMDIGLIAIATFREQSYVDYIAICKYDVEEGEHWQRIYEVYEWLDWMAGDVYRDTERRKQLRSTERQLGNFLLTYGFSPDVVLETHPSQDEFDNYVYHVTDKDYEDGALYVPTEDGRGAEDGS